MGKFSGIKLACFITGVVLPVMVTVTVLGRMVNIEPIIEEIPSETASVIVPSNVNTFVVDYQQYGNMIIGENVIRGTVFNNTANNVSCTVYLTDEEDEIITEKQTIPPGGKVIMFETTWSNEVAGEYGVKLVYEIYNGDNVSTIECPYVILLNGGK